MGVRFQVRRGGLQWYTSRGTLLTGTELPYMSASSYLARSEALEKKKGRLMTSINENLHLHQHQKER